jgi:hypothetical protein
MADTMKNTLAILFALLFLAVTVSAQKYDTVFVSKYGLQPDSRRNAVPAVKAAIKECSSKQNPLLVFPKGRYDFWPQYAAEKDYYESNTDIVNPRRCPILIEGINNLAIEGCGSEFIFHDRVQPFTVDNSSNITIKNLTVDWDILFNASAELLAVANDYMDLKINKYESPYIFEKGKLVFVGEGWKSRFNGSMMEFDKETRLVAPQTGDDGCTGGGWKDYTAEELTDGIVRIHKTMTRKPEVGNILILRHSARDHSGMFIYKSKNVTVENVSIHNTAGLGILSQHSENLTFNNVKITPNYSKGRYVSGHDDGLHFSNCKGQILVNNCEFAALMDDPINVHGTSIKIYKKLTDKKLLCRFAHGQSIGLDWADKNDKVGFLISETLETIGAGTVASFNPISKEEFELEFIDSIPAAVTEGYALENLTWTPDVTIQNSQFKSCRARGILVTTPGRVIIENNVFESSGSAILIAGDANNWFESGAVHDVLVRKNKFLDPCMTSMYQFCEAIISIYPEIPKLDASTKPFHRNIRIEENEFHPYDYPVLYAKSVDGLKFNSNTLIKSSRFKPFHSRKFTFSFEACKNIEIKRNHFTGDILGKNISFEKMDKNEITIGAEEGLNFSRSGE